MQARYWILIGLVTGAASAGAARPEATLPARNAACSFGLFPSRRDPEATAALATARRDTVPAGPGSVQLGAYPQMQRADRSPIVYGQEFEVSEVAGAHADVVEDALDERGSRTIVVVPWSYHEGCGPIRWPTSARWVEPGEVGAFVDLALRPRSRWAYGRPTFDALVAHRTPYPVAPRFREGAVGDSIATIPSLTPREYLRLYLALPTAEDVGTDYRSALMGLDDWRARYPDAAAKYPARIIRSQAEGAVRATWRYRRRPEGVRP